MVKMGEDKKFQKSTLKNKIFYLALFLFAVISLIFYFYTGESDLLVAFLYIGAYFIFMFAQQKGYFKKLKKEVDIFIKESKEALKIK